MFSGKSRIILRRIYNSSKVLSKKYETAVDMSDVRYPGKKLKDILSVLENFAPIKFAEPWDNVGLLVDPIDKSNNVIRNILLTNDLTEDVVEEAIVLKSGLIISYHPNIFVGLKSVSSKSWKERIVVECIKNNIAVFSPHTSWDVCKNGVNDWLANALPIVTCKPIQVNVDDSDCGTGRICTITESLTLQEAINKIKQHIGVPYLKLAIAKNKNKECTIRNVAVCAGSGASVLNGVRADLYLTGEMSHHDLLNATQKGIHVILCNHSDSERGFLRVFQNNLQSLLLDDKVEVVTSKIDKDPLETV